MAENPHLSKDELKRYARHISLPLFGIEGQKKLRKSSVLCIGAGGLGSPCTMYLAAAGIGKLGIIDMDVVDESNIQRQILHGSNDIGTKKIDSAKDTLQEINPYVNLELYDEAFDENNAEIISKNYDIIIDGTDNFPSRYLINDTSVLLGIPYVYGSIFRFEGQVTVFSPSDGGPCYRCLFPDPPAKGAVPDWMEGGVLGVLPGIIGTLQATEAIKLLTGIGEPMIGKLLHYDALNSRFKTFNTRKDPECKICGNHATIKDISKIKGYDENIEFNEISVNELANLIENKQSVNLVDVRNPDEVEEFNIEGSQFIPLPELEERIVEIDQTSPIFLICKSGNRSAKAAEILKTKGMTEITNVIGGMDDWKNKIDVG